MVASIERQGSVLYTSVPFIVRTCVTIRRIKLNLPQLGIIGHLSAITAREVGERIVQAVTLKPERTQ